MSNWVYGRRSVEELFKSGAPVRKVWFAEGADRHSLADLVKVVKDARVPYEWVPRHALDRVAPGNHQGVAVQVSAVEPMDFKEFISNLEIRPGTFVVLLDEVQDPQNVGAILRSALCFGCAGVILPKWRSAGVTEAVMKSSSGAAAYIPVIEISNLQVAVERLKEKGFWIYGTVAEGGVPINRAEITFPAAILLGNEERGVKPVLQKVCDQLLTIPQSSAVASLNVSNAAAVVFYELSRRPAR